MRIPRATRSSGAAFGMTAMIDMAFLLITFFVMSLRLGQQGQELVTLPRADQAKATRDDRVELLTINVTSDARYIVGGVERSTAEIVRWLGLRKNSGKRLEVVVRGDHRTRFQAVQTLMRLAAESGIRDVSLAALQLPDEKP